MLCVMAHRTVRSAAADQSAAANRLAARRAGLGERLRQLRVAAGLTQTDLAGARFSKEYISQIEHEKLKRQPARRR